jgi:hypothetical protein
MLLGCYQAKGKEGFHRIGALGSDPSEICPVLVLVSAQLLPSIEVTYSQFTGTTKRSQRDDKISDSLYYPAKANGDVLRIASVVTVEGGNCKSGLDYCPDTSREDRLSFHLPFHPAQKAGLLYGKER